MKLKCLLAAVAITALAYVPKAQAQKNSDKRMNVVKLDMLFAPAGIYGFSYERALGERTSAQLYFDVMSKSFTATDATAKLSGFSIMPEFRYYVSKKGSPSGFFFGGYIPYRKMDFTVSTSQYEATTGNTFTGEVKLPVSFVGFGIVMGPQWLIGNRVSLELYWGAAVGSGKLDGAIVSLKATDAAGNPAIDPSTGQPLTKVYDASSALPLKSFGVLPRFGLTLGVAF